MEKKRISLSTKLSISTGIVILAVVALAINLAAYFFSQYCLDNFYESAGNAITEFSDSITMFIESKETELNVFAETDAVKAADASIHSFVNEKGDVQILSVFIVCQKAAPVSFGYEEKGMVVTMRVVQFGIGACHAIDNRLVLCTVPLEEEENGNILIAVQAVGVANA